MTNIREKFQPPSAKTLRVLYSGKECMLPTDFHQCSGMIVLKVSNSIVQVWDGTEWASLNVAGWFLAFNTRWPDIGMGAWAVVGPLKRADKSGFQQMTITDMEFYQAMRQIGDAEEKKARVPELLSIG